MRKALRDLLCDGPRQLLWALVDKILASIAIGTIGAREHNVLPGVFGKSRGVGRPVALAKLLFKAQSVDIETSVSLKFSPDSYR